MYSRVYQLIFTLIILHFAQELKFKNREKTIELFIITKVVIMSKILSPFEAFIEYCTNSN